MEAKLLLANRGWKWVLTGFFLLWASTAEAQHDFEFNNQGALVRFMDEAEVFVWGDVHMEGNTATFNNDGFLEVQGNLFSDNQFQQRGTGTVRLENNDVNTNQLQFIQGSYAVRGGQAQIGTNDGSFYNLELANTRGQVHLNGVGNVADVRNSVDFNPATASGNPPVNRIITVDTTFLPANGSGYPAVFGMLNATAGMSNFINNTVNLGGNMSGQDEGFVQGQLRRAISSAGGAYGFPVGLEPAGAGASRGVQYVLVDFGANNYDVVTSFFEQGSGNSIGGSPNECGMVITYFAGSDHGEWMFSDRTGGGSGNYEVRIWPQDGNWPAMNTWFVTKDNAIQGNLGDCGTSHIGLDRAGFSGFLSPSEFNFAGSSIVLSGNEIQARALPREDQFIEILWTNPEENNLQSYEVERSLDQLDFTSIGELSPEGNDQSLHSYRLPDHEVVGETDYYYRIKYIDRDGLQGYSNVVKARLGWESLEEEVKFYPVPFGSEDLNLQILAPEEKDYQVKVYDAIGKLVYQQEIQAQPGISEIVIGGRDWASGSYIVHLRSGNQTLVKKVLRR